ncbi:hypothetical protein MXB_3739 [Myxobolus squamalis]|nr:hypothetical protein MXB_3739 [Myxobolus squamalis]
MLNSKNLHLFILAIIFKLLYVGISEPEEMTGCDFETKVCTFEKESNLETLVTFKGNTDIKLKKQEFYFVDGNTGARKIYEHVFCGVAGKLDCSFLSGDIEALLWDFKLGSGFSMGYGTLKWRIYDDKDKWRWVSQYSFSTSE